MTSLQCGHGYYTASGNVSHHSTGTAVDIATVNGIPIIGHQGSGSITDVTIRRILTLQGAMEPDQIISLMTYPGRSNTLAMGDHADHIHVGYRPVGDDPQTRQGRQVRGRDPQAGPVAEAHRPHRRDREPDRPQAAVEGVDQGHAEAPRQRRPPREDRLVGHHRAACGALSSSSSASRSLAGLRRARRRRLGGRSSTTARRSGARSSTACSCPRTPARSRPLLVLLHGRSEDGPKGMVSDALEDALDDAGDRAPIVLLPDGGEGSYWHNRRDGAWTRMVMREAIPGAIEKYGADPDRVAVGGISMGGFGALHLAAAFPDRWCAVGAHSPAIFPDGGSSAPGAFDDAEDFDRHDLLKRAAEIPPGAWVDVGDEDSFAAATRQLVERMRSPRWHPWKGGHDADYWDAHIDEYVRFYARELAGCRKR